MKRRALALTFILALLFSAVAGTELINWTKANPWMEIDWVSPAEDTKPPTLTILSPQKDIIYNSSNIFLNFTANIGASQNASYVRLMKVYYKTDWQKNATYVYKNKGRNIPYEPNAITEFSYDVNLTGVQDGKHSITVHAIEWGAYIDGLFVHMFSIDSSSSVNFTIDTAPPSISVLTVENKTYGTSDVPLRFTVNESVSQITYVLDGQANVTITGNTTLTGLSDGSHTLTVYANDVAGHTGISETIAFNVRESFPTTLVAIPLASVVVICLGLLAYFTKIKKTNGKTEE